MRKIERKNLYNIEKGTPICIFLVLIRWKFSFYYGDCAPNEQLSDSKMKKVKTTRRTTPKRMLLAIIWILTSKVLYAICYNCYMVCSDLFSMEYAPAESSRMDKSKLIHHAIQSMHILCCADCIPRCARTETITSNEEKTMETKRVNGIEKDSVKRR